MWFPAISGVIDRRILINFRVDREVVQRYLPAPFRPKLYEDKAIVGICLIRLISVRPKGLPALFGFTSENGAHRVAVEWDAGNGLQEGVFVPRRDTSSRLNAAAGGRVFPGEHHRSRFYVHEGDGDYAISFVSEDQTSLSIKASETNEWNSASVFPDMEAASEFMRQGKFGYSPVGSQGAFEGLELRTERWQTTSLVVSEVSSSFFMNQSVFPKGSVEFDCAMLMRNISHEWHGLPSLGASAPA